MYVRPPCLRYILTYLCSEARGRLEKMAVVTEVLFRKVMSFAEFQLKSKLLKKKNLESKPPRRQTLEAKLQKGLDLPIMFQSSAGRRVFDRQRQRTCLMLLLFISSRVGFCIRVY